MGLKIRKSFKVAPGVRVNVGKRGVSANFGGKGLRYNVHSSGRRTTTVGIPGTGISYSSSTKSSSSRNYRTSAYQRQKALERQRKEQQKLLEIEQNKLEVQLFENKIEMIHSIHKECDDPVDWVSVKNTPAPFNEGEVGPKEREAIQKLKNYKPNFFTKILKQDEKKKFHLGDNIEKARQEDQRDYEEWKEMIYTADRVLKGDIDTYFEVIDEFSPLDDLLEFGSRFEFFAEDSDCIEVEFEVQSDSVVPKEQKTLTKTGKISVKEMPKGKYFDILQDYVCSCVIRIARDIFALLPIKTVYIHAMDQQLNTATGHMEKGTILSVRLDRDQLEQLNFDHIDCSDAIEGFENNMKFKKTQGFQFVNKLNQEL